MKLYNHTIGTLTNSTRISCASKLVKVGMRFLLAAILLLKQSSCEDFVTVDPPITEVVSETVYESDGTAIAAVRGIYSEMIRDGIASGGASSITNLLALSSDDAVNFSPATNRVQFNTNSLLSSNSSIADWWNQAYRIIYYTNSVLEGVRKSSAVTQATRDQLEGEAKFIRAFLYFYLVNLFGDVPIIVTTDFRKNNAVPRDSEAEVFQQIISNLQDVQDLLADDYSFSAGERVQPNLWAATALLARTYLYVGDWHNAEIEASKIINNTDLFTLQGDLDKVFLANSKEAIWQLKPVLPGRNTREASAFINVSFPTSQALANELVNAFEGGDGRRLKWLGSVIANGVTYYHPLKYKINELNKPLTEYSMVLRLAEQYLIRAEARARQNDIIGSQADLNAIRNRAGLPSTSAGDQQSLLLAIERERRVELFTEWGHRWFDLKRTGRAGGILSSNVLKDWQDTDILVPIPHSERERNVRLTQNDGY